jgi:hypothetical protein
MHDAPVRAIFGIGFPLDLRPLPSIPAAEHALLECRGIGEASNVTGLTIAKIERRLGDCSTARAPMRPDEIAVHLIDSLTGARSSDACQQNDRNYYRASHGSQPLRFEWPPIVGRVARRTSSPAVNYKLESQA